MTEAGFQALKANIIQRLSGLDTRLTYHNLAHTLDVMEQAVRISVEESITDPDQLLLVKIAALYHDTGFLFTYRGHEEKSCEIARQDLADSDLTVDQVNTITGMIMATKIPQNPANLMEEILCDADLDYLGRDDYPPISDSLKIEFLSLFYICILCDFISFYSFLSFLFFWLFHFFLLYFNYFHSFSCDTSDII